MEVVVYFVSELLSDPSTTVDARLHPLHQHLQPRAVDQEDRQASPGVSLDTLQLGGRA